MLKKQINQTIFRLLTVILMTAWLFGGISRAFAFSGSGTSGDPYLINDRTDWDSFVLQINSNNFNGKYIKLTADIDIGSNITPGSSEGFRGTFDGNGHTIKVNVSRSGNWIALFRYAYAATIKNLRVVGSIHNTGTSSENGKFAAGLVGDCEYGTVIQNCIISVTITSDISGDGSHGGIVGYVRYATTNDTRIRIENCLFNGKLLGSTTNSCGGFVGAGYNSPQICEIRNCLFSPLEVTMSGTGSSTFSRCGLYNGAVSYSCYTKSFGLADHGSADYSSSSQFSSIPSYLNQSNNGVDGYAQPWELNEGGNVYLKTFKTTLDVTGWMAGATPGTSSTNPSLGIMGGEGVTYEYKRSDLLDEYYSTTAPTTAGHYDVRATTSDGFKSKRDFYVYDPPTPKTGLIYNGNSQTLATYNNTAGGDFYFDINNTSSSSTPTGSNAGTYTVEYIVVGKTGYNTIGSKDPWIPVGSFTATIDPKPLENPTISLDPTTYSFDGTAKTPSVTVKDGNTVIPESEYTLSFSDNTNAGTPTVTITDKEGGNYIVNGSTTFTITPKVVSSPTVEIPATTYTGSTLKPTVTVKDGDTVIDPSEYTVTYDDVHVNVGDVPVVTIADKDGGNYTVNGTGTFEITKAAPTYTAPTAKDLTYNMNVQELINPGSTNHGTFEYSTDGKNFTTTTTGLVGKDAKEYPTYYRLLGDSNHSDIGNGTDQSAKYLPVTIKAKPVTSPEIILSPDIFNYDGTAKQPTVTVRDGAMVISSTEYRVIYQDNVNAGTATVKLEDNPGGNYDISGEAHFTIIAQQPGVTPPTPISGLIYNTKMQNLIIVGMAIGGTMEYSIDDGQTYSIAVPQGKEAQQYKVLYRVKGDGNHIDREAVAIYSTISPKTVSAPIISLSSTSLVYDGAAKEPSVTVKDGEDVIPESEYTVEYSNNVNVGTGMVIVMDKNGGNYIVNGSTTFQIISADAGITPPTPKTDLVYTGQAQVLINEGSATGGTMEYSLDRTTYSTEAPTGTDAKEYKVYYRVTGDANHGDETATSLSVTISPKKLSQAEIILQPANFIYDGTEKQPAVTVMDGELKVPASEYTVNYSNNQKVGTGTVTLVDNDGGNYIVSGTANFAILSAVAGVTLPTAKTDLVYNGSAQELITAGNAVGGTMEYSLDNKNYSTKVPTGTDAKQYDVYFRVIGDAGHDSMDPVSMIVKISAKTVSNPSMELTPTTNVYTGKALTPTVTLKDGDTGAVIPASEYTVSYSNNINIGTANITITDNPGGNYTVSMTTTFVIYDPNIGFQAPKPISGMVYNGKAQSLVVAGTATEGDLQYSLDGKTYSTSVPVGTNADTYTVWYRVVNPKGEVKLGPELLTVIISPKTVLISVTLTGLSTQSIPVLTVVDEQDNALLKSDYTVTYKTPQGQEVTPTNGQLPEGDYEIIVRPTGNYSGPAVSTTFHVRGELSFVFIIQTDLVPVCLPYNRTVPDSYEVYYFDRVEDDGTPLFKRILQKQLKAGEPYILHYAGTSAGTRAWRRLDLSPSNPAIVDLSTPIVQMMFGDYVFTGIYDDMSNQKGIAEGAYILQDDGMWRATASSKQADAGKTYLEAFHAYLRHRDRSTDSPTINVKMSPSTTGINSIILEDEDGVQAWYDLNGRRIDQPQRGVNILRTKSGKTKKIVIK